MEPSAVILAGGRSTRMGRDKAWVEVAGRSLLGLAVDKVRDLGIQEVLISGRPGEDYAALGCPVVLDLEPGRGPLGGMERALHGARSPLVLVLAVDLPEMTAAFLSRLIAGSDRDTGVVPVRQGRLEPLVAIYPRRCHALAVDVLGRSRRAARDFAAACLREGAVRPLTVTRAEASCFRNCNTPGDLWEARTRRTAWPRHPGSQGVLP